MLVIIQVNGIKGASVFLLFKPFDLVKGFVVDWMHSVCLGVSKSLMNLWLNTENRGSEFFLGSKVHVQLTFVKMTWKKIIHIALISFFKYILQRKFVYFLVMSQIAVLNKRLLCIKVPDVITRCPRSLADHGTWKGINTSMLKSYIIIIK